MSLTLKFKSVKVKLFKRALEREVAPVIPMSLALKSKSVKVELFERALEREVAPESEI